MAKNFLALYTGYLGVEIQQRVQSIWIFAGPTSFQLDPARIQQHINFFKK
jgi:hypothetical protein